MATVLEIISGIAQAVANARDGAHDKRYSYDGEERKVGLKREEGDLITDSRVIDGFSVKFHGNQLILSYQSDIKLTETHDKNFESNIESMLNDIAKFIRKEYKIVTGNNLSLSKVGEPRILVQNTSRVRTWVQANQLYDIGGMGETELVEQESDDKLNDAVKKWLSIGKDKIPGVKKDKHNKAKNDESKFTPWNMKQRS